MELTFFLPFPGALLVLTAVLCPQKGSLGLPHATGSGVCPLQELPPRGGEVSMLHPSQVCRNTFAWYSLRCSKGSFIAWSALLLLCWWLWVLLCGRELFLHPLLTEDSEPSPPQATQQVTLKQRWILWTLWINSVPAGWRQGWC